ncbi:MAG: hypothetical protein ABJA80_03200 [bacterium]
MKRYALVLCTFVLPMFGWAKDAGAQSTALTVSGSPAPFTVTTAVAGSQPIPLTDAITTYFVKAKNAAGPQKITAHLDSPMPAGTTLTITMSAPSGATSLGPVTLDMTDRDIVINIARDNGSTNGITYVFTATVSAGVLAPQTRTVTLTESSYP